MFNMFFNTATPNVGSADLVMGDPRGSTQFVWDPCHKHYHWSGYARYQLYDRNSSIAAVGRKQSFCLMDSGPWSGWIGE